MTADGSAADQRAKPYRLEPVSLGGVRNGKSIDQALLISDRIEDEEIAARIIRQRSTRAPRD
jgi:hypothetical protein